MFAAAAARISRQSTTPRASWLGRIPTVHCEAFTDLDRARDAARSVAREAGGVVVKLDCLAAGKGVVVADSPGEAERAVDELSAIGGGQHGCTILVEERLAGPEASVMCFSDGVDIWVLPPARDHKRAFDGDQGPNTGGMGAIAPASLVTDAMQADPGVMLTDSTTRLAHDVMSANIERKILKPAIDQMAAEGALWALYSQGSCSRRDPRCSSSTAGWAIPKPRRTALVDVDLPRFGGGCVLRAARACGREWVRVEYTAASTARVW